MVSTVPINPETNGHNIEEPTEVLLIDNFDSFTWNLYQSLSILGANVRVVRNDAISTADFPNLRIKSLIISPGPGHPRTDSGISRQAIGYFAGKVPVLGVCMGLECIVDLYGGEIDYAGEIMHGKTSKVRHDGRGIFKDIPQGILSTRYHSLSANVKSLPDCLAVTSTTLESSVIMGARHREYTVESVQYHPESIMSDGGDLLIKNFLELKGGTWAENPKFDVIPSSTPAVESTSKSPTILEKIGAQRLKDIELAKSTPGTTPTDISTLLSLHLAPPQIQLLPRIREQAPALMAEIKRASPSKGAISLTTNAAQQALTYALAGASVISVLTEPTWFKGSLLDMRLARQAIDSLPNRPAILRKDFILDEYQISEARLHGADTVLLIVAMLSQARLYALYAFSTSLGMEPLVEVNNAQEMQIALDLGAKVIGVNNRNLHDFEVDMGTTSRLVGMCKERNVVLCALSGISARKDVAAYVEQGVGAVLVGESLMRAADPTAFIRELLDLPAPPPAPTAKPLVKICGIKTVEQALHAAEAGADMLGLVFAPHSRRVVNLADASTIVSVVRSYRHSTSSPTPFTAPSTSTTTSTPWFATHADNTVRALNASAGNSPLVVGVFQHQSLEEILHIVASTQIDLVQLHGDEPLQWARQIPVPVIRAFHVGASGNAGVEGLTRPGLHEFVLLDSVVPGSTNGLSGGSGVALDWNLAKRVVDAGEGSAVPLPIFLAGGLTPENVGEAVNTVRPWAVDVSGGVESGGVKDPAKVVAFIKAAKGDLVVV